MNQKVHLGKREANKLTKSSYCDCPDCDKVAVCFSIHNGNRISLDKNLNPVGKLVTCKECIEWMKSHDL